MLLTPAEFTSVAMLNTSVESDLFRVATFTLTFFL